MRAYSVRRRFSGPLSSTGGPSDRRVQRAADKQQRIAQRFDIQPLHVRAREPPVLGIGVANPLRAELVRRRKHNLPMQRLDRPAVLDQPRREVIEQLRMSRTLAARAEIARGRHDAPSEVMHPHSIRHHSCRQRMAYDRLRQLEPARSVRDLHSPQNARQSARHGVPERVRIAAHVQLQIQGRRLRDPHRVRILRRQLLLQALQRGEHLIQLRLLLRRIEPDRALKVVFVDAVLLLESCDACSPCTTSNHT